MAGETNESTTNDTPVSPAAEAFASFPEGEEMLEFPSGLYEGAELVFEAPKVTEEAVKAPEPEKALLPDSPPDEEAVKAPEPEKALPPDSPPDEEAVKAPEPEKALPPEPEPELFGKDAIRALLQEAGARYPLQRDRLLEWARPKSVLFWRDYPRIPLGELLGLSRSSIFHSEDEVLAHVDSYLRVKPGGPIFSTNYGR